MYALSLLDRYMDLLLYCVPVVISNTGENGCAMLLCIVWIMTAYLLRLTRRKDTPRHTDSRLQFEALYYIERGFRRGVEAQARVACWDTLYRVYCIVTTCYNMYRLKLPAHQGQRSRPPEALHCLDTVWLIRWLHALCHVCLGLCCAYENLGLFVASSQRLSAC